MPEKVFMKNLSKTPIKPEKKDRTQAWQIILIALFLFYMLLPIFSTYVFSIATRWDRTILPEGYTFEYYGEATDASYFVSSLRNSMILSVSTILVSLVLIIPTVYWVFIRLPQARSFLDVLMILPFGIPTVVLALALVQVYNGTFIGRSPELLIGAVFIYSMPFMYRPIVNAMRSVDALTLTEAGQSLGATTLQVLLKVIIPNIYPGIISGSLLVFATVFAEFTLTKLILGARFKTFPLLLVEYTRINGNIAAAFSVISFSIAWLASILILWVGKKGQGSSAHTPHAH